MLRRSMRPRRQPQHSVQQQHHCAPRPPASQQRFTVRQLPSHQTPTAGHGVHRRCRVHLQVQGRALFPGSGLFEVALAAAHAARANDGSLVDDVSPVIISATIAAPLVLEGEERPQPRLRCVSSPRCSCYCRIIGLVLLYPPNSSVCTRSWPGERLLQPKRCGLSPKNIAGIPAERPEGQQQVFVFLNDPLSETWPPLLMARSAPKGTKTSTPCLSPSSC